MPHLRGPGELEHPPGALSVADRDLYVRRYRELQRSGRHVVGRYLNPHTCQVTLYTLRDQQVFQQVFVEQVVVVTGNSREQ